MQQEANTLFDYLKAYSMDSPQKPLFGDASGWLTVHDVTKRVVGAAGCLAQKGIRQGTRAALRMNQTAEAAIWLLALQVLGAVALLTDPRYAAADFLTQCTGNNFPEWEIYAENGWKLRNMLTGRQEMLTMDGLCPEPPEGTGKEPAIVIYTSGSTGRSKGVVLCQQNLISNLLNSAALGGYSEADVALGALPQFHVFGLALLTGSIVLRHSLYFMPGTDLNAILAAIQAQGITRMNGVPAIYLNMARQKEGYDLHTLRIGYIGASACTAEQFAEIENSLNMTLIPVYGMSECIGISCASYKDPLAVRAGGVGRFYSMNCGRIFRENGAEAAPGEVGEICVNGPMRMLGYCDEAETRAAIDEQGFLHTGDLGYVDEIGVLHLNGRKKEIIIRNGVNLMPRRIEEALLAIPGVRQAAVVGIPHSIQGEVPYAMVVSDWSEQVLTAALAGKLPKNEIPVGICIVDQLPLTASGKPDKKKIREELNQWVRAQS